MFKLKKIVKSISAAIFAMSAGHVVAAGQNAPLLLAEAGTALQASPQGAQSKTSPDSPLIKSLLSKARYWKKQDRMDLAAPTFERVLQSNPGHEEALAELAAYQASMGHAEQAGKYVAKLKQVNPKHPVIAEVERKFAPPSAPLPSVAAAPSSTPTPTPTPATVAPVAVESAPAPEAEKMAQANRLLEQGHLVAAEAAYRDALKLSPGLPEALLGVANVLLKQKKYEGALEFLDQYDAQNQRSSASTQLRSGTYVGKGAAALAAGDFVAAEAAYRDALKLSPELPDALLGEADALLKQKKYDEALAFLDQHDAVKKGASASAWMRSEIYVNKADGAQAGNDLDSARIYYGKAKSLRPSDPWIVLRLARFNLKEGKPEAAEAEVRELMSLSKSADAKYVAALVYYDLQKWDSALAVLDQIPKRERTEVIGELRVRLTKNMSTGGVQQQVAQKSEAELAQELAQEKQAQKQAQKRYELMSAVGLACDAKDYEKCRTLLSELESLGAFDRVYSMLRAWTEYNLGNYEESGKRFSGLYQDSPDKQSAEGLFYSYAKLNRVVELRPMPRSETLTELLKSVGMTPGTDIWASPDRLLSGNEVRHSAYLEAGYAMRYKSGTAGLGYMYEKEIPVAWHIPLEGEQSSIVLKATEIKIDAGDVGASLDLFGTNLPAAPLPVPYVVNASGTALSAGYQSTSLSADIGVSPLGFKFNNIVGGLRWNQDIASSNVALEVSRRSVAESVLSYAGAVDNVTGMAWGGVTKTGGQVSVYYPFSGGWAGYASAGLYDYSGTNVANNNSNHLNATLIYDMVHTNDFEATVSARLSRTSFNNNQSWFYWGHGGYYSPQRDNSLSIPLHVAGKTEKLAYEFNITPTAASVNEDPALVYPTDPVRQAAAAAALVGTTLGTTNKNKGTWTVNWTVEYQFAQQFVLGNRFQYEESPLYQQLGAMFYLRYDFDKKDRPLKFPPNSIRPHYITTQGGAGLN